LELREPLRRRPISAAVIGGLTGLLFGMMAATGKPFPASAESVAAGYVLGGLAAGAVVGLFLPEFRRRWLAAVIVGIAMTLAFLIAFPLWGEDLGIPGSVFLGLCCGIIYGVLLWDYRTREDASTETLPNEEL
jgi:O-antigen ligase